jgi:dUTP pyrophosphatase
MIHVDVHRLHEGASLPSYGTSLSSCFDLGFYPSASDPYVSGYDGYNTEVQRYISNPVNGEILIRPGDRLLIPTGLVFKIGVAHSIESFSDISKEKEELRQFSIRLHPRSGLSLKRGLVLANSEGVVDVDYQQQVFLLMTNISQVTQIIKVGDRLAQAEVSTNEEVRFLEVKEFPSQHSERSGGFGSTG